MNIKFDVSIIIINYNTLELTKNIIDSIFEKTLGITFEIILVDNNSQDGSKNFFITENYINKIVFIQNKENIGFGRANNIGIKKSKGKYIFLLNSDTLLINNAIKILYDFMEKNKNVGICGGNLYDASFKEAHSYNKMPNLIYDLYEIFKKIYLKIVKKRLDFNYGKLPKEVGYITGADMFIRKEILEEVGIFDSDFFMYFEETELTYRIKQQGYKVISVPQAKIIHLEGKSFEFKEVRFQMICESKYKYYYKIYGLKKMFIVYIISQFKYLLVPNKINMKKYLINREEYKKILFKKR